MEEIHHPPISELDAYKIVFRESASEVINNEMQDDEIDCANNENDNATELCSAEGTINGDNAKTEVKEITELQKWAIKCNVPQVHTEKLLSILRK